MSDENAGKAVKKGDKVSVEYEGRLKDGEVFDSNKGKEPLEFEVGSGSIIKGFDEGMIGMQKGEEKTIDIPSDDAYGVHRPELVQKIPKEKFNGPEPKEGMMIAISTPEGKQFPAKIVAVDEKEVTLDINHPLAGKDLSFSVKVLDINPA